MQHAAPQNKNLPLPATRAEALARLAACRARLGQQYGARRNYDPDTHGDQTGRIAPSTVSGLSPYIRRRLLTETEVIAAALGDHRPKQAEKFIQEVLWRSYFKGWLEQRPGIWQSYTSGRARDLETVAGAPDLAHRLQRAETGTTGLACFDAWARQLCETGYLHNHARMWFASIWIFVFALPWRLGADFFLRHLLDGDPASNTCSWRWVAGLHTPGKTYEAQAWNIAKFTENRFTPTPAELTQTISDLTEEEPDGLPPVSPLRTPLTPDLTVPTALLLTEEDCSLDQFLQDLCRDAAANIKAVACLPASTLRSSRPVSDLVIDFETEALKDCAARLGRPAVWLETRDPASPATPPATSLIASLVKWATTLKQDQNLRQIVTPFVTQGPLFDALVAARPQLAAAGITLTEWQRPWDALVWPHATAGFFKVKKKMPDLLQKAGLA